MITGSLRRKLPRQLQRASRYLHSSSLVKSSSMCCRRLHFYVRCCDYLAGGLFKNCNYQGRWMPRTPRQAFVPGCRGKLTGFAVAPLSAESWSGRTATTTTTTTTMLSECEGWVLVLLITFGIIAFGFSPVARTEDSLSSMIRLVLSFTKVVVLGYVNQITVPHCPSLYYQKHNGT